jgi:hypothetical protein
MELLSLKTTRSSAILHISPFQTTQKCGAKQIPQLAIESIIYTEQGY